MAENGQEMQENLKVKNYPYIKIPIAVRDKFGNPEKYPNPKAKSLIKGNKVKIIYEFDMTGIEKKK